MTELSSLIDSLTDLGSKELSILLSPRTPAALIRQLDGSADEKLISVPELSTEDLLTALAPVGKDFRKVTIISTTPQVTYLPDGLFDIDKAGDYLDQVFGEMRQTIACHGHIPAMSVNYVFRLDEKIYSDISAQFPQAHLRHLCGTMMLETWAKQRHDEELMFRLHQQNDDLFLIVFKGKQLALATHHRIGDPTDVVYHCLNSVNSFGVDYDTALVVCSGSLSEESEGLTLLKSYCLKTKYNPAQFSKIDAPGQFILATQSYCE